MPLTREDREALFRSEMAAAIAAGKAQREQLKDRVIVVLGSAQEAEQLEAAHALLSREIAATPDSALLREWKRLPRWRPVGEGLD